MGDLIKEIIIDTENGIHIKIAGPYDMDILNMASALLSDMQMKPLKDAVGKTTYKIVDNLEKIPVEP